jgi:hypothetical protein
LQRFLVAAIIAVAISSITLGSGPRQALAAPELFNQLPGRLSYTFPCLHARLVSDCFSYSIRYLAG